MSAAGSASISELVKELAQLRQENAGLRARIEAVERVTTVVPSRGAPAEPSPTTQGVGFSRRSLMRRGGVAALAGLGAAAAGSLLAAAPAAATDGAAILAGQPNLATLPTVIAVTDESTGTHEYGFGVVDQTLGQFPESAALAGHANADYDNGVLGYGQDGTGVRGISDPDGGIGVHGSAAGNGAVGIQGSAHGNGGRGVVGAAKNGTGVFGGSGPAPSVFFEFDGTGVAGVSTLGPAVVGFSSVDVGVLGYGVVGGAFEGRDAQISLAPGSHTTHPAKGTRGSFYVDKTGRLWYCRTGGKHPVWHQLA